MSAKQKNKIAALIKTVPGRSSLMWTISGILNIAHRHPIKIYLADEQPLDHWKKDLYPLLIREGHFIHVHGCPTPVGKARNHLLRQLQDESFILRLDDDFDLGGEFNLEAMVWVLENVKEIEFCADRERQIGDSKGVCSGALRPSGGKIKVSDKKIIKYFHGPFRKPDICKTYRYHMAEHTRNLLLIKRDVFNYINWSEEIIFSGEHLDFLLTLKERGFKGAYTTDSIHLHRDDLHRLKPESTRTVCPSESALARLKHYKDSYGTARVATSYPISWYGLEVLRRCISRGRR